MIIDLNDVRISKNVRSENILDDPAMLLALLILCALMSGWFSLMETSIAESHRTRLEKQSEDGDAESQTMLKILDAPENLLAAAQAGFALSIMLAGLASILFAPFILNRLSDMQFGWALAIIAAFCITAIVVLLIGVFIPRAAARHNPEQILLEHYKGFTRSAMLMTPLTFVLTKLTGVAMMLSGSSTNVQEDAVTEDVVKDLIEQGTSDDRAGHIRRHFRAGRKKYGRARLRARR